MGLQTSGRASVLFWSRDRATTLVGGQREPLGSEGRLLLTTPVVRQPQTKRWTQENVDEALGVEPLGKQR